MANPTPLANPTKLAGAAETLLIPLYGRARASQWAPPLLDDPKAQEIVASLDYDFARFARFNRDAVLVSTVVRTVLFDRLLRAHLERDPDATVVELGVGLNTRFERLDNGRARWLELDLPDAIELRRRHFHDGPRRTIAAASVLDPTWLELVGRPPKPPIFVAEAVLYYLPQADVARALAATAEAFPGSLFLFDTASQDAVARANDRGVLHGMNARLQWACDEPSELRRWAPCCELVESHKLLLDLPPHDWQSLPLWFRAVVGFGKRVAPRKFDSLRINAFRLQPATRPT